MFLGMISGLLSGLPTSVAPTIGLEFGYSLGSFGILGNGSKMDVE